MRFGSLATFVYPAGTANRVASRLESEKEVTSMVISISAPGTEGGGGGLEDTEAEFGSLAGASSFFFFLPKSPPSPFTMACEALVGGSFDVVEGRDSWFCWAVSAPWAPAMAILTYCSIGSPLYMD